ncbi:hypothetical protein GCM10011611_30960 [Aliidongia dinghuensis]|uniref:SMI1/KNR4 family protein n=1 Tax=Aliidongia dinghuensis TaxID=1867774 RepID=A0A8J2YVQ7_9PROT|nr:hypothetical protein [Aliidongia dinghuensis]GGF22701.1 hypothetical protein GCM10011611_30960 [Aliidongia dinghuensis]
MDVRTVQSALLARGVKLAPPASKADLDRLGQLIGPRTDGALFELYSTFNGFEDYDRKSQIFIWPIARVLQERDLDTTVAGAKYVAFGDVMIDSDFLILCSESSERPIYLRHEQREMAESLLDFLKRLTDGAFDFL